MSSLKISEPAKSILVTGVGGNVGQGILRNVSSHFPNLRRIGTDIGDFSAGHHFCSAVYSVPYGYDPTYHARILEIVWKERIDLIIPSTDYEAVSLSRFATELPPIVACHPDVGAMFLDKFKTAQSLKSGGIPFAESCLPSDYEGEWDDIIVKPREGRGSRDLFINPQNLDAFDDSFVVQKFSRGKEITVAFYVTRNREVLGLISMERRLTDGVTVWCKVVFEHDAELKKIINLINDRFILNGPLNLQAIVEEDGAIVPFEINCRYSGTNSIRSQFGFHDVKYGIQEYLLNEKPAPPCVSAGTAVRLLMDVIYKDCDNEQCEAGSENSFIF